MPFLACPKTGVPEQEFLMKVSYLSDEPHKMGWLGGNTDSWTGVWVSVRETGGLLPT